MSDPRTPSRAERARLRWIAERVVAVLEGGSERATRMAIGDFQNAVTPEVLLSLLAALDEGERERENRNSQALGLITVLEFHGKRAVEMGEACAEVAKQLRDELAERRAANQPEEPADV